MTFRKTSVRIAIALALVATARAQSQNFFRLQDVRPGMRGVGRTVFHNDRVEDFQVEILGVLENLTPKQSIILARLSGGPLEQTGVMQGMSGSPVYIDGKLLGAIALGFPFSKEPIAGIQPIEQMIADATFTAPDASRTVVASSGNHETSGMKLGEVPLRVASAFGDLSEISTPLALSGFSSRTLQTFAADFRKFGFEPQQGVSAGSATSQQYPGRIEPGSMISVQLLSGDWSISADGTVTYVDGQKVYAFGHRFLDAGPTELPFARSEVVALLPTLNTSYKLCLPRERLGTILSDRSTAIAGLMGRTANTIPLTIAIRAPNSGNHDYHFQVVNDRLLTPFIAQTAIFSAIEATERTLGPGTTRLRGHVEFESNLPPLIVEDIFVSDSGLAQQVSQNAVVTLGFVLGAGFTDLRVKQMTYELQPANTKRQVRIAQVWASRHDVRPGESIQVTALLQGENGIELTRTATYHVPVGAALGPLNLSVSDASGMNTLDFAGLTQSSLHSPAEMIHVINDFRSSDAAYVRVWRQQPSFTISGPLPGGDISDPPPSVMLILADPSNSATTSQAQTITRGSQVAEIKLPVDGFVVSGSKTIQVEVKE